MARPKKSGRFLPLLVVVVLVAAAGMWYRSYAMRRSQPKFETRAVKRGDVEQDVLTTGNLQCIHTVAVGSQVSGIVLKMLVDFNSLVHKGQIVANIDPSTFETQLEQNQAQLDQANAGVANAMANLDNSIANLKSSAASVQTAEAAVNTARVGILTQQAQLRSAEAAVEKSKAALGLAQMTYNRDLPLRKRDLIPQSQVDSDGAALASARADLDNTKAQVEAARTNVDSARVALDSARTGVDVAVQKEDAAKASVDAGQAQVTAARETVKQQQATLKLAAVNLGYCVIRSPVNGIVIQRNIDPGQTIAASLSAPQLYLLGTDLHKLQVLANLDESDMAQVFKGQQATFTIDAYPSETFKGVVSQVRTNSSIVNNVVTYQLLIDVDNPKLKLLPSMTANVSLLVKSKKDVILVPNMALRFRPDDADLQTPPPPLASGSASASPGEEHHHHHGGPTGSGERPGGPNGASFNPHPSSDHAPKHQRVWIVQDNHPSPVDVNTGVTDGSYTEVLSGLTPGQEVIVTEVGPTTHSSGQPRRMF